MTDEIVPGALFKRYKAQSDATSSTPSTGNDQTTSEIPQASTSAAVTVRDSETVASVSASTNVRPSTNTTASTNVTALATAATSTGATASTNVQPAVRRGGGGGGPLLINQKRQKANPMISHIRNVRYEFADILPDFELGSNACCLYLSIDFHKKHSDYIMKRIDEIGSRKYNLKVLLVRVDVTEPKFVLRELNALCLRCEWTMILANSIEEAAEYLENFKLVEFKTASVFRDMESNRKRVETSTKDILWQHAADVGDREKNKRYLDTAIAMLTSVRGVNRSDAQRLLANFGSLRRVAEASIEQLTLCPGLGLHKARRLHTAMRTPFVVDKPATAAAAAEDDDADEEM